MDRMSCKKSIEEDCTLKMKTKQPPADMNTLKIVTPFSYLQDLLKIAPTIYHLRKRKKDNFIIF